MARGGISLANLRAKRAGREVCALIGMGRVVAKGRRVWVVYAADQEEAVHDRLRKARFTGGLPAARGSAGGNPLIGRGWSVVMRNGVAVEIQSDAPAPDAV